MKKVTKPEHRIPTPLEFPAALKSEAAAEIAMRKIEAEGQVDEIMTMLKRQFAGSWPARLRPGYFDTLEGKGIRLLPEAHCELIAAGWIVQEHHSFLFGDTTYTIKPL